MRTEKRGSVQASLSEPVREAGPDLLRVAPLRASPPSTQPERMRWTSAGTARNPHRRTHSRWLSRYPPMWAWSSVLARCSCSRGNCRRDHFDVTGQRRYLRRRVLRLGLPLVF